MANWTNIPTDRIEPGKPIRAIDGLALRDNPIAIAEGAAGAPRVQTNGIANSAVTTSKIANSNVTAQKLATGGNENNWVRSRIATSTAGAVGTYAFVTQASGITNWGGTVAGSVLRRASVEPENVIAETALSGTWRIMGHSASPLGTSEFRATLALRIS